VSETGGSSAVNRQNPHRNRSVARAQRTRTDHKIIPPTILIVDDDASLLRSLEMLLSVSGFRVKTFAKPSELLASDVPHSNACLIVDINLPELNGFRLCEMLKKSGRRLPTILITGRIDPAVRQLTEKSGAVALLFKPFEEQELLETISSALALFSHEPTR
jgi:FixJ family two-component response regulator